IRLYHTAKKNLNYVYLGNTELTEFNHTYCHVCQNILIERKISHITTQLDNQNVCPVCHTPVYGRF
ncbi:MAG: AmmeMemoRadiSam system radical SAM enzyme, partial [Candidatus Cloacimonetes bacterium]|nr:AmmeMemoRadiSam system radical SAM enzyme [Candidatus Cloacimonadota bacterium]